MMDIVGCPLTISALFAVRLIYDWKEVGWNGQSGIETGTSCCICAKVRRTQIAAKRGVEERNVSRCIVCC